jgi:glutamate synthase (NADPH/NADH) small chain
MLRTSTSHEEGADRNWSVLTKEFRGDKHGHVQSLSTVQIEWYDGDDGRKQFRERPDTERTWPAQLVLLAMGFVGPEKRGAIEELNIELDTRGNVQCDENYMTSHEGVFAAGDIRRGQSLVVWAISEGREAARSIDRYLMGVSNLPSTNAGDFAWR